MSFVSSCREICVWQKFEWNWAEKSIEINPYQSVGILNLLVQFSLWICFTNCVRPWRFRVLIWKRKCKNLNPSKNLKSISSTKASDHLQVVYAWQLSISSFFSDSVFKNMLHEIIYLQKTIEVSEYLLNLRNQSSSIHLEAASLNLFRHN